MQIVLREGLREEIKGTTLRRLIENFRGEIRGADSAKGENKMHDG